MGVIGSIEANKEGKPVLITRPSGEGPAWTVLHQCLSLVKIFNPATLAGIGENGGGGPSILLLSCLGGSV